MQNQVTVSKWMALAIILIMLGVFIVTIFTHPVLAIVSGVIVFNLSCSLYDATNKTVW